MKKKVTKPTKIFESLEDIKLQSKNEEEGMLLFEAIVCEANNLTNEAIAKFTDKTNDFDGNKSAKEGFRTAILGMYVLHLANQMVFPEIYDGESIREGYSFKIETIAGISEMAKKFDDPKYHKEYQKKMAKHLANKFEELGREL